MTTSPLFKRVSTWAVEVSRDGERILTIGSNILAGADMTPENETVVRDAAHHLLSFLGDGFAASPEPPAESAWRTIESAPAGVEVLVCGIGSAGYYVVLAKKIDGHWMMFCSEDDDFTLLSSGHSHWQPLPAPSALSNKG